MRKLLLLLLLFPALTYGQNRFVPIASVPAGTHITGRFSVGPSATRPTNCIDGDVWDDTDDVSIWKCFDTDTWTDITTGGGGSGGTVTSVGLTGPGGIFAVSGSPVTDAGSLGLSVTGVAGGIPYFASTSGLVSSGLLNSNILIKGGGVSGVPNNSSITDDGSSSTKMPNGVSVMTLGINRQVPNGTAGTGGNLLVCHDVAGKAQTCPTSTTAGVLGVAAEGTGTTGSVQICFTGRCAVMFDNSNTVGDYAIPSTSVAGELHDTGSMLPTPNTDSFYVDTLNSGAGTIGFIAPPGSFGSSSSSCAPMTGLGDMIYGAAAGVCTRLAGPTAPNGVPQFLLNTPSGGVATAPAWTLGGVASRSVTGTTSTDTLADTDRAKRVNYVGSVAVAVTLPTPATLHNLGYVVKLVNKTSGTNNLTVTATSTTINGNATLTIHSLESCTVYVAATATLWEADCVTLSQ